MTCSPCVLKWPDLPLSMFAKQKAADTVPRKCENAEIVTRELASNLGCVESLDEGSKFAKRNHKHTQKN